MQVADFHLMAKLPDRKACLSPAANFRLEVLCTDSRDGNFAPGKAGSSHERSGYNPVTHYLVLGTPERTFAFHTEGMVIQPHNMRTHFLEQAYQVEYFRISGGIVQDSF
jgi:hypothetical protein